MNAKEIEYNLLEVEKGNKQYGIYLKNHILDQQKEMRKLNNLVKKYDEELTFKTRQYEYLRHNEWKRNMELLLYSKEDIILKIKRWTADIREELNLIAPHESYVIRGDRLKELEDILAEGGYK